MKEHLPQPKTLTRREVLFLGVSGAVTAAAIGFDYYREKIRPQRQAHQEQKLLENAVKEKVIFQQ